MSIRPTSNTSAIIVSLLFAIAFLPLSSPAVPMAPVQKGINKALSSPITKRLIGNTTQRAMSVATRAASKIHVHGPAGVVAIAIVFGGALAGAFLSKKRRVPEESSGFKGEPGVAGKPGTGVDVGIGVVAPESTTPGGTIMVQVAVDVAENLSAAIEKAKVLDKVNEAAERGSLMLHDVADGTTMSFQLDIQGLTLEDTDRTQSAIWKGSPFFLQFFASVPKDAQNGVHPARLLVFTNGRPVGRIGFTINVKTTSTKGIAATFPHGYSEYFVSYSEKDFDRVLPRIQGIRIAERDFHFFFDKFTLSPGEQYESVIFDYIDNKADVFLLFWSNNSATSKWVEKEWRRALDRQKTKQGLPDIVPVPLDRNAPPPPMELSHLHFGDALLLPLSTKH